jgi:peptidoglycan/LPS O-acetylase OafA/YrhL
MTLNRPRCPTSPMFSLLHLWSLAVEEQFYFLFPFAVFAAWKKRFNLLLGISVIGILSFAINVALVYPDRRPAAFYLPQARFWELMIGSGLAYAAVFWKVAPSAWDRTTRNPICLAWSASFVGRNIHA